jgi:hypothetical protein
MRVYGSGLEATTTPTALRGAQCNVANTRVFWVLEVGVFNSTTTACTAGLQRHSAGGTAGAAVTEQAEDPSLTPNVVMSGVNSTDSTAVGDEYVQAQIGAAIGAGVIWTFGGKGITVPGTASHGITLTAPTGTGQFRTFYFVVEE